MLEKIKEKFLNKSFLSFAFIGAFNTILSQILYMIFVSFSIAVSTSSLLGDVCLLYTSPSPRDRQKSRMPSSA